MRTSSSKKTPLWCLYWHRLVPYAFWPVPGGCFYSQAPLAQLQCWDHRSSSVCMDSLKKALMLLPFWLLQQEHPVARLATRQVEDLCVSAAALVSSCRKIHECRHQHGTTLSRPWCTRPLSGIFLQANGFNSKVMVRWKIDLFFVFASKRKKREKGARKMWQFCHTDLQTSFLLHFWTDLIKSFSTVYLPKKI